ncbi:T9SS type A sorting domain-containing protein [Saccharicrinis sp. FJH62]|uniref:T9SS type A sorting domain-containing protein n=1 Tax=Saccharicrinis sp. FJH62 TaxID=3344657 RepID=UPI0035D40425
MRKLHSYFPYLITLISLALFPSLAMGQSNIVIEKLSGESSTYTLGNINKITFPSENIRLSFKEGSEVMILLNDIKLVSFSNNVVTEIRFKEETGDTHLFPVPATKLLNINYQQTNENSPLITIYDAQGKEILKDIISVTHSSNLITIDIGHLKSGFYFLRIQGKDHGFTEKFIKN